MLSCTGFLPLCSLKLLERGAPHINPELDRVSFVIDLWHFLVLIDAKISAVSEYLFFRSLQQVRNRCCIVYVGCGRLNLVDQSGIPVHTDVPFESEILLVILLHLMGIRVAFLLPVLGR